MKSINQIEDYDLRTAALTTNAHSEEELVAYCKEYSLVSFIKLLVNNCSIDDAEFENKLNAFIKFYKKCRGGK